MAVDRSEVVGIAVLGAGRIGANHAEIVARRVPGAALRAVADPVPGAADRLAGELAHRRRPPTSTRPCGVTTSTRS